MTDFSRAHEEQMLITNTELHLLPLPWWLVRYPPSQLLGCFGNPLHPQVPSHQGLRDFPSEKVHSRRRHK